MPVEVRDTVDYRRVRDLPRRRVNEADAAVWARVFTEQLRFPGVSMVLGPWQGQALYEAAHNDGAVLGLPVGFGKTLIAELLPVVMGAVRPILVAPAVLEDQIYAMRGAIQTEWHTAQPPAQIVPPSRLAPESGAGLLDAIDPDLIIIDECDELSNPKSSAVRRLDRFILAHPHVKVVCMTGTLTRKSIMGYWHLLCWALRERAPVPMTQSEASIWALAIDESRGRDWTRVDCGPLGATVEAARAWYRKRLTETPGVLIVDGDSAADVPLTIRQRLAREDPKLDSVYREFLRTFEAPGGEVVTDPLSRWRIDGQFGCGLYTRFNPPPAIAWRDARRESAKFVRAMIANSDGWSRPLDTEAQVFKRYPDNPIVSEWRRLEPTYDPEEHSETVWFTDSAVMSVVDWLNESTEPGAVWCGSVDFAEAVARVAKLSYYGRKGRDQYGGGLHAAPPDRSFVASWHANKKGFNLQAWRRALVVFPPQSAKWLEQLFGRHHRQGQTKPVTIDVLITSGGTLQAFDSAIREANFARDTVGMTQKILRARIVRAVPKITASNKYRWATG
jgi:hypothetical protein